MDLTKDKIPSVDSNESFEEELDRIKQAGPYSQSNKFKKAARELESDESEANFEQRLKKVVKQKPSEASNKS